MANLEPMPISSLPEGSIQDGDKMIIYRDSNGKAYQSDASSIESVAEIKEEVDKLSDDVEQISADLTDKAKAAVQMSSANDIYVYRAQMSGSDTQLISVTGECMSELTNGDNSNSGGGFITRTTTNNVEFVVTPLLGVSIYSGRVNSAGVGTCYKHSGTQLI